MTLLLAIVSSTVGEAEGPIPARIRSGEKLKGGGGWTSVESVPTLHILMAMATSSYPRYCTPFGHRLAGAFHASDFSGKREGSALLNAKWQCHRAPPTCPTDPSIHMYAVYEVGGRY